MSDLFPVFPNDLLQEMKLSLKTPSIIEEVVSRQIVFRVAKQVGIHVEADELQRAADRFRLKNKLSSAEETFEWLQHYQLSIEDFESLIYSKVLTSKLSRHLFESQIDDHFLMHKDAYSEAVFSEVIVPEVEHAYDLFQSLEANNMTFDQVVDRYAQDPEIRRSRRYRGKLHLANLDSAIAKTIVHAVPPQILVPIVIHHQAHLIYVEALIQPELTDELRDQIRSHLFIAWLKERVEQAEIRVEL
jgi:hypothetical protein